ncbi:unnamed protein product [Orchesella dallaii]|uniref:Transmembrane protein n=1 Tax=Orchesella dallaii TaxID=48710 RepID=A0ABP1Q4K5_9HEXA
MPQSTRTFHVPQSRSSKSETLLKNACWCTGVSIERIAKRYAITDTLICVIQLACYIRLYFWRSEILEDLKNSDKRVCDTSMKDIDEPDDCEEKATNFAIALLLGSIMELLLAPLILFGTYNGHVDSCYIWFTFAGLFVFIMPFLQYIFLTVTTWWNVTSYIILALAILHGFIKLFGMVLTLQYIHWIRNEDQSSESHFSDEQPQVRLEIRKSDNNANVDDTPKFLRHRQTEEIDAFGT